MANALDFIPHPSIKKATQGGLFDLERVNGIEPSYAAWEAAVLPLNYTRIGVGFYVISTTLDQAAIF